MKVSTIKRNKFLSLTTMLLFVLTTLSVANSLSVIADDPEEPLRFENQDWANGIPDFSDATLLNEDAVYPENFDVGNFLSDNENNYKQVWDPWLTQAAIHAIATTDDGDMMALAGGYLYDNEIHLYRWNYIEDRYDLVWEIGGDVFNSDVFTIKFTDSDYNNLTEIVAGTSDGYIYVFEQRHIYDPITNMENQFDLVWQSERLGRVFDIIIDDTDGDFRKDIIVGTGDTVRWYEYENHGNYPFTQDHWIDFKEVASFTLPSQITSLGISDVDSDGLKEVAVGTRSGKLHLLENNGTSLPINGFLYPIMQDNSYTKIWDSGNIIRRPITDMEGGDLDGDGQRELLMAVQGQGAFILDTIDGVFGVYRLQREFETWESNPIEIYPLDVYTDSMINSSSIYQGQDLPISQANVYYQNASGFWSEPLNYTANGNFIIFPYSSYSVMNQQSQPDGRYTTFNSGVSNPYGTAWAVYDFGNDEEAAGNGISSLSDLKIYVESTSISPSNLNISISADNVNYFVVNATYVEAVNNDYYFIEVDPTLAVGNLDFYRYIRVEVLSGVLKVDVLETLSYNYPIYDALSVEMGSMTFKDDVTSTPVGFIGTIDGAILGVTWDASTRQYRVTWDSWRDERYKLQTNIFDLEIVKKQGRFPAWISYGDQTPVLDLNNLPNGDTGTAVSWTAENFYDLRGGPSTEYMVFSSSGNGYIYSQSSPQSAPVYNPELTNMMFNDGTLGTYINQQKLAGIDYFAASIVPTQAILQNEYIAGQSAVVQKINPAANAYWLFLSEWDGSLGNLDIGLGYVPDIGEVEITIWYLEVDPTGSDCGANSLPTCSYWTPLGTSLTPDNVARFSTSELTGQMWGILRSSTWMPKVASADLIGGAQDDYIVTNGKIHLLEVNYNQNPGESLAIEPILIQAQQNFDEGALIDAITPQMFPKASEFNFVLKGGYFDTINDNSKGRLWSNANPVDFDGDGDIDLIVGYARYSNALFGFDKSTYGVTYWENEGSRSDPIWVERSKAMNNNDVDSNLKTQLFTDPVLIYEEYDFGEFFFNPTLGFHPLYKTDRPTRMLMFQPISQTDIFTGSIQSFFADYDQPTSLLAATFPEVKRLDINLKYTVNNPGTEINYGFHIFETWNNEEELKDWTLSLSTADLDNDGKNEIIVGDFNNNIYVFEHLTNNTFKRAYKSFNVNRTIETDLSPYANDLFGGIDGNFQRTLFDHVVYLIAGFDLNGNGRQEFIGATESMIFIFESVLTPTGLIRDDSYALIGTIDLLAEPALSGLSVDEIKVTSMTWGNDFTNDGRGELIVAVSSALLIFEFDTQPTGLLPQNPFSYEEIFFGDAGRLRGLYDLPGNYYMRPNTIINAVLVEDLDNDGFMDLAIGGIDTSYPQQIWSGFVNVLEWRGSSFSLMEQSDEYYNIFEYAPVYDLAVDDADFDGNKELIIGHKFGVDIYEFISDDYAELRGIITGNPGYKLPERSYYNPLTADRLNFTPHKDVARDPNTGRLHMVYTELYFDAKDGQTRSRMMKAYSDDDGANWIEEGQLGVATNYNLKSNTAYLYLGPEEPSLVFDKNDVLWLSFVDRYYWLGVGLDVVLAYVVKNPATAGGNPGYYTAGTLIVKDQEQNTSPRVFDIEGDNSPNKIGLVSFINKQLRFEKVDIDLATQSKVETTWIMPWANGTTLGTNFNIQSLDIVQLDDPGTSIDRNYGLVISGYPYNESLSLDRDLFYVPLYLNDSSLMVFNYTSPNRMFSSGMSSVFPSIIQEQYTRNLMVTYEQSSLRPYGGLFAVWSNDFGISWNGPYDMSHPLGLDNPLLTPFPTKSGESYRVGTVIGPTFMNFFEARRPVIVPGGTAGFSMVYTAYYQFDLFAQNFGICRSSSQSLESVSSAYLSIECDPITPLSSIVTAINPYSNFTWYELGSAKRIAVGDSDRDGRHEILVASGKQAFLFEYQSNGETFIQYRQKWKSEEYERDLTSIAISDANGNGLPELILESDRGIVRSYEVINAQMGQANIMYPVKEAMISESFMNDPDGNLILSIEIMDVNSDGTDDFVYDTTLGEVVAIDGADLSVLYKIPAKSTITQGIFELAGTLQFVIDTPISTVAIGVQIHQNNITTFDVNTGVELIHKQFGSDISAIEVADVIEGSWEEIIVGFSNGTIVVLNSMDLSTEWIVDFTAGKIADLDLRDIRAANFLNGSGTDLAITTYDGWVGLLDGETGSEVWRTEVPVFAFGTGISVLDITGNGFLDMVIGDNFTIAFEGSTGSQLWNVTNPLFVSDGNSLLVPLSVETIPFDVNEDGTLDLIYSTYNFIGSIEQAPSAYAMNGKTGAILWTYSASGNQAIRIQSLIKLETVELTGSREVLVAQSLDLFGLYVEGEANYTFFLDPYTGVNLGGIPTENAGYGVAISNLGFDRPVAILGDYYGNVNIYSLWEGNPPTPLNPPIEPDEEPFFVLGTEFTRRTQYLLQDITNDGVDDVFVIDDDYIGVGDTKKLLDDPLFNEVIWAHDVPEFGRFIGPAKIGDIDGDGDLDIVAAFENFLTAIDARTGAFLWNFTYFDDDLLRPRNLQFELVDMDPSAGTGLEIVYSRELKIGGIPVMEIGWIKGGNENLGASYRLVLWENAIMKVGDFSSNPGLEIFFTVQNTLNPLMSGMVLLGNDFIPLAGELLPAVPPIMDIAVGNFDLANPLDEFILFFEMSALDLPAFLYALFDFPTLFIQLRWNDGAASFDLPSNNVFGLSPLGEGTRRHKVVETPTATYLIGQSRSGDLFSMKFDTSGGGFMTNTGTLTNIAAPYAKTAFLVGDFFGSDTLLSISAANAIVIYDSIDLGTQTELLALSIDFDVIQDIVAGDLDGDSETDILIASFGGYVWVLRSELVNPAILSLSGEQLILDDGNMIEFVKDKIWIITSVGISISILVLTIRRKIYPKIKV